MTYGSLLHAEPMLAMYRCTCGECGAPAYVAWSGKRQWMELLNVGRRGKDRYQTLQHGLQHTRPKACSHTGRGCASSEVTLQHC